MLSIGSRILEERNRLKMSQAARAAHCQVTTVTQGKWERGKGTPNAGYLAEMAKLGVDVLYVVTGMRMPAPPEITKEGTQSVQLNPRQQALIKNYDAADEVGKTFIEGTANLATQPEVKRASGGGKR